MRTPAQTALAYPSLEELRDAMLAGAAGTLDHHGRWRTDLPCYGGTQPKNTLEVWSWDADRLLVGACATELEIVSRAVQS